MERLDILRAEGEAGVSEIPFHRTVRGARFYDHELPRALQLLERLLPELRRFNDNIERVHELIAVKREEENK